VDIDGHLRETLEDRRLSRKEKKALRAIVGPSGAARAEWHARAFEIARDTIAAHPGEQEAVLEWLDAVTRVLVVPPPAVEANVANSEVLFSPGVACRRRLSGLLGQTKREVSVRGFTITDDRLAGPLLAAHRRGVGVRIISDDDKAHDRGSDVRRLAEAGVPVRYDDSPHHMHHKFAVFDGEMVATGSYNWTRSAADDNRENLVVTDDRSVVRAYADAFEELWKTYGGR